MTDAERDALDELRTAAEHIAALTDCTKPEWDADTVLRWAVTRLWIALGNAAERYRLLVGAGVGNVEPGGAGRRRDTVPASTMTDQRGNMLGLRATWRSCSCRAAWRPRRERWSSRYPTTTRA